MNCPYCKIRMEEVEYYREDKLMETALECPECGYQED